MPAESELVGDLLVVGVVWASGGEDDADPSEERLGRGMGAVQGKQLLPEIVVE